MSDKKRKLKKAQKSQLMKLFFKIMGITFIVCAVLVGGVVWAYNQFIHEGPSSPVADGEDTELIDKQTGKPKKVNKNLAVFGVDKDGYRTDVIFVVNFNSETNKAKVISIPRDTKVSWTSTQQAKLKESGRYTVYTSKINEMTAYGGIENIRDYTIDQIQNMLGIKIDNYVIVSISAFKEIVDAIGGVDMNVPQDMYYVDNADGLYINLKAGEQHLDGEKAEQLIRFRRYPEGDVARVRTQQIFLEAFAKKVMSPSIITKIPKIINVLFDSVQTDIRLTEIPQYYSYATSFDLSNLTFHIIPGEGRYENGVSYFFPDEEELDTLIDEVFNDKVAQEQIPSGEVVVDKSVTIEVLNGSGVSGLAKEEQTRLEELGYTVSNIGNYTSYDMQATTIYAKDSKLAMQFKEHYPNCEIIASTDIPYDIQIVLGQQ